MLPVIATNPLAGGIFLLTCLIWIAPEVIGAFKQTAKATRGTTARDDRGSMAFLIGLQWLGVALCLVLGWLFPVAAIPWQRTALFALGVTLILLGVALRWYAIWALGAYFTRDVAVSADQPVVRSGPYRWIRHPAYSGTFLTMLGLGLALTNWASLGALLVCVLVGHLYRVRVEEQALMQTIGQPYVDYMRQTRRFIPFVV